MSTRKDLAGGSQVAVATSPAVEAYPACDAGRVVYMYSAAGGSADIRLRNIGSGETVVVSDQYWNEWRPAISEDRVVWQAWPTQPDTVDGIQIMGKRLSTGETFTVTSGPGHQTAPTISRSVVAWEDARPQQRADTRLWWRDLETTTGEKPTDTLTIGAQQEPALSERGLVYRSSQPTGVWNVWRVGLSSE